MMRIIGRNASNKYTIIDADHVDIHAFSHPYDVDEMRFVKNTEEKSEKCYSARVDIEICCYKNINITDYDIVRGQLHIVNTGRFFHNYDNKTPDKQQKQISFYNNIVEQALLEKLRRTNVLNIDPELGSFISDVNDIDDLHVHGNVNNIPVKNSVFIIHGYDRPQQYFGDENEGYYDVPDTQTVAAVSVAFSANKLTDEEIASEKTNWDHCYVKAECILPTGKEVVLYSNIVDYDDISEYKSDKYLKSGDFLLENKYINIYLDELVKILNCNLLNGYTCSLIKTDSSLRSELLHRYSD